MQVIVLKDPDMRCKKKVQLEEAHNDPGKEFTEVMMEFVSPSLFLVFFFYRRSLVHSLRVL